MSDFDTKVCPNYCTFGSYGGGHDWKMMMTYMEDDWGFCPKCSAPALVFKRDRGVYSKLAPENPSFEAFEKEQKKRFLYWRKKRRSDFNWQLCATLPPVPEEPKKKRARPEPEVEYDPRALEARRKSRVLQTKAVPAGKTEYSASIRAARLQTRIEIYPGKQPRPRATAVATEASEVLLKGFLVHILMQRFKSLNPDVGTDVVDWHSALSHGTFDEGVETMQRLYPQYQWEGHRV